jgi:signal transduction histidine kinase
VIAFPQTTVLPQATILVVGDRPTNLIALATLLAPLGQSIVQRQSVEKSLEQILWQAVAVIVVDLQPLGLDEVELARQIRSRPESQQIPLLFLSSSLSGLLFSSFQSKILQGDAAGTIDYLPSPVVPELLRSKVAVFVDLFHKNAVIQQQVEQLAAAHAVLEQAIADRQKLETRLHENQEVLEQALEQLSLSSPFQKSNRATQQNQPDPLIETEIAFQDRTERQRIEQMKTDFISIASHELRTPATAIQGSLKLLATGLYDQQPTKAREILAVAVEGSDRLIHLVNDILSLERLNSGKAAFVKQSCNVADLMQEAIAAVQAIADQAAITLTVYPLFTQVWADADAILQTLIHLLDNAIKFSPSRSAVWLSAEIRRDESTNDRLDDLADDLTEPASEQPKTAHSICFRVKDQGCGIPTDQLESIFARFQQVDASDSRHKSGSGLGLAICQHIVQQHDGKIWAESSLGEGSTFYFVLPWHEGG